MPTLDHLAASNGTKPGEPPMPMSRDDQMLQVLQDILRFIQTPRNDILPRAEYERRHEDLQHEMEMRLSDTRERLVEIAGDLQKHETEVDGRIGKIEDKLSGQDKQTISMMQAILLLILSSALTAALGVVVTLLVTRH